MQLIQGVLPEQLWASHQQTPESEAALLVSNGVLAVEAALALTHRLHGNIPLCISAQRLHRSVAAEDESTRLWHW